MEIARQKWVQKASLIWLTFGGSLAERASRLEPVSRQAAPQGAVQLPVYAVR